MRGNVHKLYRVLVLYVWLLVVPGVSLCVYTTPAESVVYDLVSPGTLQPGSPIPSPIEPVVLTVRGRMGLTRAEAAVTFDIPTLERLGLIRFTTPTAWTDGLVTFEGVLLSRLAVAATAEATQLVQLANQAMTWAHELVRGLSPIALEADDVLSAMQGLATQAERLFGITCRVTYDRPPPMLAHTVATHLYRIAQEAVSNAVKHGQARRVVLALTTGDHSTSLTVHDDGTGFPELSKKSTGMGLRIMHYRASMIGASLAIHSDASSGTTVVYVWPHPQAAGDDGEME